MNRRHQTPSVDAAPPIPVLGGDPSERSNAAEPTVPGVTRRDGSLRASSVARLWRDGFVALGPDRSRMVAAGALAVVAGTLETVLLYLVGRLAVAITSATSTLSISGVGPLPDWTTTTSSVVVVALGILAVLVLIALPLYRMLASMCRRSIVRIRSDLIRAHLSSAWSERAKEREAHFAQIYGEYSQRSEQMVQQLGIVIVCGCEVIMIFAGVVVASPAAAVVSVVGLLVVGLCLRPVAGVAKREARRYAQDTREVVNDVQQTTRLATEIASYNVGDGVATQLEGEVQRATTHLRRFRLLSRLIPVLFQYFALGVVLGVIGAVSLAGSESLAAVAPVILLLVRALTYLRQLQNALQSGAELAPYFDATQEELARLRAHSAPQGEEQPVRFSSIQLHQVSFHYVPDHPVLADIDLTINRGDIVGIVGRSGEGKTTLTYLLLRLLQPTSGRISVDGVDLSRVRRDAWARFTAFVPQESKLILGTVADNVRFYREGFTDDDVERAGRKAHLHDEIMALPQGYHTVVGPGARSLSGGQSQRLAIARALLGRPELLILDEPTSALDSRSELLIRQTLAGIAGETTIVLVAHRPATLEICTRVVGIENGSISHHLYSPATEASPSVERA